MGITTTSEQDSDCLLLLFLVSNTVTTCVAITSEQHSNCCYNVGSIAAVNVTSGQHSVYLYKSGEQCCCSES